MSDPIAYLEEQRRRQKEWAEEPIPERNPELEDAFDVWHNEGDSEEEPE